MSTITRDPDAEVALALQQVAAGQVPDAIVANARELDKIRDAKKVIEKREKVLRDVLLNYLSVVDKDAVASGGVAISKSTHDRTGIDMNKMKALYPKVLAAVEKSTPVTQVRVEVTG